MARRAQRGLVNAAAKQPWLAACSAKKAEWARLKAERAGETFTEAGASYMGFAVSALLASALADRPRYCIAFTGDGSFIMNPQILIDGAVHGVRGMILLFDNRRMGAISSLQTAQYGHGRDFATSDDLPVDFVRLATAVQGVYAVEGGDTEEGLKAAQYDAFSKAFAEGAKRLVVGPGLDPGVQMGALANARGLERAKRLVADALSQGAELLAGGGPPEGFTRGFFFAPTVLGRVPDTAKIMQEEPFVPVAPISAFETFDEVIRRANAVPYGLAGFVFTRSLSTATRASEALEVGMVGVNGLLLSTVEMPFGGVKSSGMGREGGRLGILDYLEAKYTKLRLE